LDSSRPDIDAQQFARELAEILGDLRHQLAVIGGVAYNFWREPRYTNDIDFNVVADAKVAAELRNRLVAHGYEVVREQTPDATSGPDFLRFILPGTRKIVEFQAAKTPYQELTIKRAVMAAPDQPFPVATAEDVIVLKLIANRPKDHRDMVSLGMIDGLDWDYIEHWAEIWGVAETLANLRGVVEEERQRVKELFA
jgi:hypothetical protein